MNKRVEIWFEYPMDYGYIPKLTGRWKIKITNGVVSLYLEEKGLFFNTWLDSDWINYYEIEEYINDCAS